MLSLCRSSLRPNNNRRHTRCKIEIFCLVLLSVAFVSQSFFGKIYNQDNEYISVISVSAFQQIILPFCPRRSDATTTTTHNTQHSIIMALAANDDDDNVDVESSVTPSSSSSLNFALSPTSEEAKRIVREKLGLSSEQYQQLAKLAVLVDDWNTKINLISRRDCSKDVVFGRHILPSLAPLAVLSSEQDRNSETGMLLELSEGQAVCDVGTGGGFPGLPLAIARPDVDFLLVDSIGKKINAVQDMADTLGLTNVKTYHGRAESVSGDFSWVVGRSVSALPTYCFWIHHLLKKESGKLVYLIGGEIDEDILDEAVLDEDIEDLLDVPDISDKRVLVFPKQAVDLLAEVSGEVLKVPKRGGGQGGGGKNNKSRSKKNPRKQNNNAKGQWAKRDSSSVKDRGFSNFQRFDSLD